MRRNSILYLSITLILASCSMTKNIPDDDKLFVGLKQISYPDEKDDDPFEDHLDNTKEEIEAALATAPNGSLFGSSYYTLPWSWHLWVYNKYAQKDSGFARWMTKSFGTPPVLMSQVNPALHASVARSVLQNNGYFRGDVTYDTIPQKNPKKQKLAYTVHLDSLFTLDSIDYVNFPDTLLALIDSTRSEACIKSGDAFSMSALEAERIRISNLFRNNGYYYFNSGYASYLADTFNIANKAKLRFQLASGLPSDALRKKYIGNISVNFRKSMREQLTDSIQRRHLTINFKGKKSPIRPRVILKHLRLRPGQEYSYDNYLESANNINATNVFSSTDFVFTPRTGTDTLDLALNCVFDKPYDFYIEGNVIGKTIGNYGPELRIGFTRRNAFKGGEKLDINLHGAYEMKLGGNSSNSTYQYGIDAAIEFPRIIAPFYNSDRLRHDKNGRPIRRQFYSTPTTYAKVSTDIVRRPEYYKMHVVSGEWTYRWQTSATSRHEFSPLTVKYQYKNSTTELFDSIVSENSYLSMAMDDYFIPKMRYTYTYTSPQNLRNPIRWETTFEEAGNLISLFDMARGKSFMEQGKELFKTPYAQFLRLETDFTKTWSVGMSSKLVAHLNAGYIWSYGNSDSPPFTEMYYTGGANSIRAYGARELGPGRTSDFGLGRQLNYLLHNGDMRLVGNLEYRFPIFGNLHGALFLDAGNVWYTRTPLREDDIVIPEDASDEYLLLIALMLNWADQMKFKPSCFLNDITLGTGVGLRYDLGFLVIRLDWGYALHAPFDTGQSGYFGAGSFNDRSALHFAIGYPF